MIVAVERATEGSISGADLEVNAADILVELEVITRAIVAVFNVVGKSF